MELIPIFFGCLFSIACCLAGLVYSIKARGRQRWGGLLIAGFGSIGLFPLLAVSPPLNMSLSSLSGTYQGDFGSYENKMQLNKDGSFDQQMTDDSGKVYKSHGTWKVGDGVSFDRILMPPMETWGRPQEKPPKLELSSYAGSPVHVLDGGIYFSEDDNVCIKRVSEK